MDEKKRVVPWLALFFYAIAAIVDWYYAYSVQGLADIITNSWMVLFPLFSYFYIIFGAFAALGIFYCLRWGFGLGYIVLIAGTIASSNSYISAFKLYPITHELYIFLLIINFFVITYLGYYYLRHPSN